MYGQLLLRGLLVFSVSSLAFFLGIWAARKGARRQGTDATLRDILSLTGAILRFMAMRMASNMSAVMMISVLLVLLVSNTVSFFAGYGWRDHELASKEHTLLGMEIVKEYPAGNYDARTESGTIFPFYPCPESPRLQTGVYRLVRFEQRDGCKRVVYWIPSTTDKGEVADVR